MEKVLIPTVEKEKPIGAVSKAVKIINPKALIFVSTHDGRKDGVVVKGDIENQAKQALRT